MTKCLDLWTMVKQSDICNTTLLKFRANVNLSSVNGKTAKK